MSDKNTLRVANCSGFYGDRLSAAFDLVNGGPIDVLTGDYLAELTMGILYEQYQQRGDDGGYVGTFLKQLKDVATLCAEKNIKIISNAGGLNPAGLARKIEALLIDLGIDATIAYIDGDDLIPRMEALQSQGELFKHLDKDLILADCTEPLLTANVYLGAWGIKTALDQGADIVVCPRVTDAALVIGPAAWKFNWQRDDYNALAGALAAGHIIECGAQACGGNYAFFEEVPSFRNIGYPIAEIEADGSFTITKHPGTGGLVSVGTVTAQILYEICGPAYLNPDVTAHFDSLTLTQVGYDRVQVTGCRGASPAPSHKVCITIDDGFQNSAQLFLTGLDIEQKAAILLDAFFHSLGGREQFDNVETQLVRSDHYDPKSNEQAFASLFIHINDKDKSRVGRLFSAKLVELALANYPGFTGHGLLNPARRRIRHWPALIDSRHIVERVHIGDQVFESVPTSQLSLSQKNCTVRPVAIDKCPVDSTVQLPLGRLFGTRSGDKGGCANIGVWAKTDMAYSYLYQYLSIDRLKTLMPDMAEFEVQRYDLPNLRAVNFYIRGVLGEGAASNNRMDNQAKSLGEYLRAKIIDVPIVLLQLEQIQPDTQAQEHL